MENHIVLQYNYLEVCRHNTCHNSLSHVYVVACFDRICHLQAFNAIILCFLLNLYMGQYSHNYYGQSILSKVD
jgi:hypothetical protein